MAEEAEEKNVTAKVVAIVQNATVNVAMNNKMAFMTVQGHKRRNG